jgi:anthraniloyl-CoA monooxygenase
MPFSERIRNEVGIPTITVGNIWTPDQVNTILLAGRADLVALARAHLAEPYWTLRAASASAVDDPARWPLQYRAGAPMLDRITRPEDR